MKGVHWVFYVFILCKHAPEYQSCNRYSQNQAPVFSLDKANGKLIIILTTKDNTNTFDTFFYGRNPNPSPPHESQRQFLRIVAN